MEILVYYSRSLTAARSAERRIRVSTHFAEVAPSLDANITRLPDDPVASIQTISDSFVFRNTDIEVENKITFYFKFMEDLLNEVPSFIYK